MWVVSDPTSHIPWRYTVVWQQPDPSSTLTTACLDSAPLQVEEIIFQARRKTFRAIQKPLIQPTPKLPFCPSPARLCRVILSPSLAAYRQLHLLTTSERSYKDQSRVMIQHNKTDHQAQICNITAVCLCHISAFILFLIALTLLSKQ